MERKTLGVTDSRVPEIGLGAWNYHGGVAPLQRGIELGANLVDTAEIYGTEEAVGEAIKGIRERVFVASKVSGQHLKYDAVLRAAEGSLRRLAIDCIDLYQIHWPNHGVPIQETMRAMESLVDSGLIRHIGVSNFSIRELADAREVMKNYPIVSNQVLYNLYRREIEETLLPYCLENQITVIAYTPLASGKLAAQHRFFSGRGTRVLKEIARESLRTTAQVALNWLTSHENVIAIPKSDSVERTVENCAASDWRLSPKDRERIDKAFS